MKLFARLAAALVMAIAAATPLQAEEVIKSFASDVRLETDGSVHVIETITVTAEGDKIRRGIYRDIPTVLINADGSQLHSSLSIKEIRRDGEIEPYHTEGIANGLRIYIGDADVYLSRGIYRYTITYTMTRMARRFADHDELYWNATGNYWDFPIESAVAMVTLPDGAVISDLQGYTGGYGSTEQAVTISREADNRAIFRATRSFDPYEGMTVAAIFQKGVLAEPSTTESAFNYLSDHRAVLVSVLGVLVVLAYNLWAWFKVGRDPRKGTIIPRFYPPEGFSPALTHYVHNMGWKRSGWLAFTAGLVDLAVKGLVILGKEGKKNTITATGKASDDLTPEAQKLFNHFSTKGKVTVDKKSGPSLNTLRGTYISSVSTANKQQWFKNNTAYLILGFVVFLAITVLMMATGVLEPIVGIIGFVVTIFATAFVLGFARASSGSWVSWMFFGVWFGIFAANLGGSIAFAMSDFFEGAFIGLPEISFVSILIATVVFAAIIKAPTVDGRMAMDEIDGFRMYLDTAEKERLNFRNEPEMTISRFETILPFAIALGVEKPWTQRFENDLARNAVSDYDGSGYHPHWNTGSNFSSGSMSRDVAAFASGMSAAMIAAQPSSSSSSGGGGGGSSGGGGGGGGGW